MRKQLSNSSTAVPANAAMKVNREARPTDIPRRLGVSHATAIKAISRLKRAGLATSRPYRGVFLTETGHALAERVHVRHRLVVDMLRAVGVPAEAAEADAEGMEHHVSDVTLKSVYTVSQGTCQVIGEGWEVPLNEAKRPSTGQ